MIIKFDGAVVNFRERLQELEKKRGPAQAEKKDDKVKTEKSGKTGDIADIISIRNENRLAALGNIRDTREATDLLGDLRKSFIDDAAGALSAHKKAEPDRVMRYYPFE